MDTLFSESVFFDVRTVTLSPTPNLLSNWQPAFEGFFMLAFTSVGSVSSRRLNTKSLAPELLQHTYTYLIRTVKFRGLVNEGAEKYITIFVIDMHAFIVLH